MSDALSAVRRRVAPRVRVAGGVVAQVGQDALAAQVVDWQCQPRLHLQLDRRQMRGAQALPQAGRHVAAVVHRHARAADHGVEPVGLQKRTQ